MTPESLSQRRAQKKGQSLGLYVADPDLEMVTTVYPDPDGLEAHGTLYLGLLVTD